MSGIDAKSSVQPPVVDRFVELGWTHVLGNRLQCQFEQVFVEGILVEALVRLNPVIAKKPGRAAEVLSRLRATVLSAADEGLVAANERFTRWLCGLESVKFAEETHHTPILLIDFNDQARNAFVFSDEVQFGAPAHRARFDIVDFVNGLPLVVGWTKTVADAMVSWSKGAKDIAEDYQPSHPAFSVPNVFFFATEGKALAVASTGAPVAAWQPWGPSRPNPTLLDVLEHLDGLVSPAVPLTLLHDYVVYEAPGQRGGLDRDTITNWANS